MRSTATSSEIVGVPLIRIGVRSGAVLKTIRFGEEAEFMSVAGVIVALSITVSSASGTFWNVRVPMPGPRP